MIVSCPSCHSKYQVADDKVAGSMQRTRCKACGSLIIVDGTLPPKADNEDANDEVKHAHPTGDGPLASVSSAPTGSHTKPPPPQRASMAAGAAMTSTSKPPPPQRRGQTGSPAVASENPAGGASVSKRPVVDLSSPDALDPSASSSDFYSKLLSKVSASKTKSQPAPAPEPAFNPKKTYPPPHEPFDLASDQTASKPAPAKGDAFHSGPPHPDGDAAAGDFYAKILARVRPQTGESPAQAAPGSVHKTLPPPLLGAPQPPTVADPAGIAGAPIRTIQQGPGAPAAAPFNPKATAIGIGEFEVHVDIPVEVAAPAASVTAEPTGAARSAPVAPRRSEPPLAGNIQLPPLNTSTAEARPPAGITLPGAKPLSTPPTAGTDATTAAAKNPEPTLEPSVKSMAAAAAPALDPYAARPQPKRVAGMLITIIGVGLLGVGGGVAATIYALKPSVNAAQAPAGSAPVAAATPSVAPAQPQPPAAAAPAPAQTEAAVSAEPQKPNSESEEKASAPPEKTNAKSAHNAVSGSHAPAAPAEPRKESAKVASDATGPATLDAKSAAKTNSAKTALPTAPTPAAPSKGSGTGPFPKEVAQAMLGVAASQAPSCRKADGPVGTGKAIVTFDTNGQAVIVNIVGEGFSGTPTAQCVAALFRRVRVPPFAGERSTATKVFMIPP